MATKKEMMIAANIIKPAGTICGACNIIISLFEPVKELTKENINIKGDITNLDYNIIGKDASWTLHFVFPKNKTGRFTLELVGRLTPLKQKEKKPLENITLDIDYDTYHIIPAQWGTVVYNNKRIIVPITFQQKVIALTTDLFYINTGTYDLRPQVYGIGNTNMDYQLEFDITKVPNCKIKVALNKEVIKENGNRARVQIPPITIFYPETD